MRCITVLLEYLDTEEFWEMKLYKRIKETLDTVLNSMSRLWILWLELILC